MSENPPPYAPRDTPETRELQHRYELEIEQMVAELTRARDAPGLENFTATGRLPAAFLAHFNAALACFDRIIDLALAYDGSDKQVQCRKGCANCCIDLVRGINTPEIVNIYHFVRSWPDARQVFEYHRASAELFSEILERLRKPGEAGFGGDDPRIREAHIEYNRLNRPCGFLDQASGCCRIYPVRPIACRYFFSLDPPETCSPLHVQYLNRRTRTIHLPEVVHALIRELGQKLGFRPLNYLAGAFCGFAAEIMHARPIQVVDTIPGSAGR